MTRNRFRRCAASALLLLAASLAGGPTLAAETLYPRFFWRAPPGPAPDQSLGVTAQAAYPDGGLAVAGHWYSDPYSRTVDHYIYRIDATGKTIWEFKIRTSGERIGALVRDARDGLIFCGGENKVRRIDPSGHLDWVAADWRSPAGTVVHPYSDDTNDCDALLALPDGSVIVAATVFPGPSAIPTARVTRIDPAGEILWSSDMATARSVGDGRTTILLALPNDDIEVVLDPNEPPSNAHPIDYDRPAFWEWRISPTGQWRTRNKMQKDVALRETWYGILGLHLMPGMLVRVGGPMGNQDCRMAFEEWSLDGNRLLGSGYFPALGECDGGLDTGFDDDSDYFSVLSGSSAGSLATTTPDISIRRYRVPTPPQSQSRYPDIVGPSGLLPKGCKILFFAHGDAIYAAALAAPEC